MGQYELLFQLGEGGMGQVWAARGQDASGNERSVAIKLISPRRSFDQRFRAMFLEESRIALSLKHPNIVETLEVGEQDGGVFLVMERVDGEPLAQLLRGNEVTPGQPLLPVPITLRILGDVCEALHAAHEFIGPTGLALEIVHRDVSPHNVLIGRDGRARLIDFGIAKARGRIAPETATGDIKGKLAYMAPEQAAGARDIDRRADIWSLGVMLWELLLGARPYDGDSEVAILRQLLEGVPPVISPGLPTWARQVLAGTLEPRPERRFRTAREVGRALERADVPAASHAEVARYFAPRHDERWALEQRKLAVADAARAAERAARALANTDIEPRSWAVGRRGIRRAPLLGRIVAATVLLAAIALGIVHLLRDGFERQVMHSLPGKESTSFSGAPPEIVGEGLPRVAPAPSETGEPTAAPPEPAAPKVRNGSRPQKPPKRRRPATVERVRGGRTLETLDVVENPY